MFIMVSIPFGHSSTLIIGWRWIIRHLGSAVVACVISFCRAGFPGLGYVICLGLAGWPAIITHVICFCSVMGVATVVGSWLLFWVGGVGFVSNLVSFLVRYTLVSMSCAIMGSAGFPISVSFIPFIFPIFLIQVLISSF